MLLKFPLRVNRMGTCSTHRHKLRDSNSSPPRIRSKVLANKFSEFVSVFNNRYVFVAVTDRAAQSTLRYIFKLWRYVKTVCLHF